MRRRKDSGFALLLIFLMASLIAISLYMEMPRVAFQAERQKEQLLMERGEQYKRAIGLFLRTNKNTRWPASIEELENFNNRRSLRHRYIDPITGKDEWRLIHIQNGVLQDSVTNKKSNSQQQAAAAPSGFITELQGLGDQGGTGSQSAVNPGLRRRPSDGGPPVGPDGQPIPGAAGGTGVAGSYPGMPGAPGSLPGVAGGQGAPNGQGGIAGLMGIPSVPVGQTGPTGQTNNQSTGGMFSGFGGGSSAQPTVPGAPPGFPNGAQSNGQGLQINPAAQAAAAGLLQNLLTQPRPGGLQGITSGQGGQGGIIGGGIAGIASKAEGETIMVYGDRTDFSEWEFIYDPMKFRVPQNPASSTSSGIGVPASSLASTAGMSNPGTPIGTGPGGSQAAGAPGAPGGIAAGGIAAGGIASGFANGSAAMPGTSAATGSTSTAGGTTPPSSGSAAFGQAGGPDIRPGKR